MPNSCVFGLGVKVNHRVIFGETIFDLVSHLLEIDKTMTANTIDSYVTKKSIRVDRFADGLSNRSEVNGDIEVRIVELHVSSGLFT